MRVVKGFNDLKTVHPGIAAEWDMELNGKLKPTEVLSNSEELIWWKCSKGHSWQDSIKDRVSGEGCPFCARNLL